MFRVAPSSTGCASRARRQAFTRHAEGADVEVVHSLDQCYDSTLRLLTHYLQLIHLHRTMLTVHLQRVSRIEVPERDRARRACPARPVPEGPSISGTTRPPTRSRHRSCIPLQTADSPRHCVTWDVPSRPQGPVVLMTQRRG